MTNNLRKLVINCETGEIQELDLTSEEIEQAEKDRLAFQAEEAKRLEEQQRIADLKDSARAKLITGQPLTVEEASVLVI